MINNHETTLITNYMATGQKREQNDKGEEIKSTGGDKLKNDRVGPDERMLRAERSGESRCLFQTQLLQDHSSN